MAETDTETVGCLAGIEPTTALGRAEVEFQAVLTDAEKC